MKLPKNITTVILDLDGTVYLGDNLISGAAKAIERLRRDKRVLFLTNNTSVSVSYYERKLTEMGVRVVKDDIITAGDATAHYIENFCAKARFFIVGTQEFKRELKEYGITESKNPNAVLLSFDTELCYDKIEKACDLIRAGSTYIATHPDVNCPKENGFKPDVGSFIALIEASTGRRPDAICGKPFPAMTDCIKLRCGEKAQNIAMIGDRLYTDMEFAYASKFLSCLVLSGETNMEQAQAYHRQPDIIIGSIAELE